MTKEHAKTISNLIMTIINAILTIFCTSSCVSNL